MKPITRKEYYLAKAAGAYTGPTPPPVLREDYYLATLAGDYSGYCPAPVTRLEKYMSAAAGITSYVPQPVTRIEKYWYAIAKGTGYVPEPVTREERFLYALVQNKPEPPKPEYVDKAAEGSTILLTDSAQAPLTALTVYGHSTQDGTPSPENPVPIVSDGDEGEINVTVSDGGTQSQTLTVSTPGGLPGIPVASGGNYTDAGGQQWICNEVDFDRGKYVQRVKKVTNLTFTKATFGGELEDSNLYVTPRINDMYATNNYPPAICSNLIYDKKVLVTEMDAFYIYDKIIRARLKGIKDDEVAAATLKTYTFIYPLATPIETDLSDEELAAYKALYTYSPTTTVSNDAGAWMKVGYKANQ